MINILPESGRSTARREYLLRLVAVAVCMGAAFCMCAGVMLVPSYLFATLSQKQASAEEARLSQSKAESQTGDIAVLQKVNEEVKSLSAVLAIKAPSEAMLPILRAATADISITRIEYQTANNLLSVSGKAATRDSLLSFVRALQKLPEVQSAELPVGDLAKNTDVPFNLAISIKTQH